MAGTTIKISNILYEDAKRYGKVHERSIPKQIEYWSKIGRIAEENPELSYNFIKDILLAQQEAIDQKTSTYEFG